MNTPTTTDIIAQFARPYVVEYDASKLSTAESKMLGKVHSDGVMLDRPGGLFLCQFIMEYEDVILHMLKYSKYVSRTFDFKDK